MDHTVLPVNHTMPALIFAKAMFLVPLYIFLASLSIAAITEEHH